MGEDEKTAIIGAPVGRYGYDDGWGDEDEDARRRKRRLIAIIAVLAVLLLGGVVAGALLINRDDADEAPPAAQQVQVPPVVDLPLAEARQAITDAGLGVGAVEERDTTDPAQVGVVLETTPAGGAQVAAGSEVGLVVGVAPDSITVPSLVGFSEDQAREALERAGFTGNIDTRQEDSLREEGTVASVEPAVGQSVAPDGTIQLGLSTGTVDLPDVTGRPEAEAVSTLTEAGFTEAQIDVEEVDSSEPAGTVVGTTPGAGSPASTGTRIVLQVSGGTAELTVPNVRGQSAAAAEANLRAVGFTSIQFVSADEADPGVGPDQVIGTEPGAGTTQAPDTAITVLLNPPTAE